MAVFDVTKDTEELDGAVEPEKDTVDAAAGKGKVAGKGDEEEAGVIDTEGKDETAAFDGAMRGERAAGSTVLTGSDGPSAGV